MEYLSPFSPSREEGGGRDFYLDEFSNITTKIVNLKPKMRVIGAKEWIAVVTLHPSPAKERGRLLVVVTSLIFPPISIHITFIFHQSHILMFFIHLKPEVEAIGAGGKDRG